MQNESENNDFPTQHHHTVIYVFGLASGFVGWVEKLRLVCAQRGHVVVANVLS